MSKEFMAEGGNGPESEGEALNRHPANPENPPAGQPQETPPQSPRPSTEGGGAGQQPPENPPTQTGGVDDQGGEEEPQPLDPDLVDRSPLASQLEGVDTIDDDIDKEGLTQEEIINARAARVDARRMREKRNSLRRLIGRVPSQREIAMVIQNPDVQAILGETREKKQQQIDWIASKLSGLERMNSTYSNLQYDDTFVEVRNAVHLFSREANDYLSSRMYTYEGYLVLPRIGGDVASFTELGKVAGRMLYPDTLLAQQGIANAFMKFEIYSKYTNKLDANGYVMSVTKHNDETGEDYQESIIDVENNPAVADELNLEKIREKIAKESFSTRARTRLARIMQIMGRESSEYRQTERDALQGLLDAGVRDHLNEIEQRTGKESEEYRQTERDALQGLLDAGVRDHLNEIEQRTGKESEEYRLVEQEELNIATGDVRLAETIWRMWLRSAQADGLVFKPGVNKAEIDRINSLTREEMQEQWDEIKEIVDINRSFEHAEFATERILWDGYFAEKKKYGVVPEVRKYLNYGTVDFLTDFMNTSFLSNGANFRDEIGFSPLRKYNPGEERVYVKRVEGQAEQRIIIRENGVLKFDSEAPVDLTQIRWEAKGEGGGYLSAYFAYKLLGADKIREALLSPGKLARDPSLKALLELYGSMEGIASIDVDIENGLDPDKERQKGKIYREDIITGLAMGLFEFQRNKKEMWEKFKQRKIRPIDVLEGLEVLRVRHMITEEQEEEIRSHILHFSENLLINKLQGYAVFTYFYTNPGGILMAIFGDMLKQMGPSGGGGHH